MAGWRFRIYVRGAGVVGGGGRPGHRRCRRPAHRRAAGRAHPRGCLHPSHREVTALTTLPDALSVDPSPGAPGPGAVADRAGHPPPGPVRDRPRVPDLPGPGDPAAPVPAVHLRQGADSLGYANPAMPNCCSRAWWPLPRRSPGSRAPPCPWSSSSPTATRSRIGCWLRSRSVGWRWRRSYCRHAGHHRRRGDVPDRGLVAGLDPLARGRRPGWWP